MCKLVAITFGEIGYIFLFEMPCMSPIESMPGSRMYLFSEEKREKAFPRCQPLSVKRRVVGQRGTEIDTLDREKFRKICTYNERDRGRERARGSERASESE